MVSKTIGIDSGSRRRRLQLSGVGKVAAKAAMSICDTNPWAKEEGDALLEHGGGVDGCHRVHRGIVVSFPT